MFKELAKSILIYGIASSIGRFIGLFLLPIYTRIFNPEQYGIIDLISSIVALVSILGMLQLESAISRYYFEVKELAKRKLFISTAFWTIFFLSVFWSMVVALFSKNISLLLFNNTKYSPVIIVALTIIPISNLFAFFTVLIRFLKKPVQYTLFVLIQLFFTLAISVWLVVFMRIGIIGVFFGQLSGFLVGAVAMLIYLRSLLSVAWDKEVLLKLFRYSLPLVPAVGGNYLNSYANRFVILGYLSIADIGLYTVALKVVSVFNLFEGAFRMAWSPFFWENFEKPNHKEVYKKINTYVIVVVFILVSIFALFSKEILILLTTRSYLAAAPLIGILSFSMGLAIIMQTVGVGPGIKKKTIYNTLIYFTSVMVNIGFLFLLVPKIGLIGVPICLLLSTFILTILAWINSERLYYIGFSKLFFVKTFFITSLIVVIPLFININSIIKIVLMALFIGMLIFLFRKRIGQLRMFKNTNINFSIDGV